MNLERIFIFNRITRSLKLNQLPVQHFYYLSMYMYMCARIKFIYVCLYVCM